MSGLLFIWDGNLTGRPGVILRAGIKYIQYPSPTLGSQPHFAKPALPAAKHCSLVDPALAAVVSDDEPEHPASAPLGGTPNPLPPRVDPLQVVCPVKGTVVSLGTASSAGGFWCSSYGLNGVGGCTGFGGFPSHLCPL